MRHKRTTFRGVILSVVMLAGLCSCARVPVKTAAPVSEAPPPPVVKFALIPPKPDAPYFAPFNPVPAPQPTALLLRKGDRLALCGDSITEQKMYSRAVETYLTVCEPELEIGVRQFGWGGETAAGFLARMTNDVLRFLPTVATTCYGMNDHGYQPYTEAIGPKYREASTAIVRAFEANGVRVVHGSPGCVGSGVWWSKATSQEMNLNLCTLRNIGVEISTNETCGFSDVFWPMLVAADEGRQRYGTNYALPGVDGVHPGWAGSFVMAYAFLRSFGLDGEIGTFTADLKTASMKVSDGHELVRGKENEFLIRSRRYPFCATGPVDQDSSIRSAMTLVPFNSVLNRFILIAKNGDAKNYKVTWGNFSRTYTVDQLKRGVNLAEDFPENPFLEAFNAVDRAVAAKQAFETQQIKQAFRSPEALADMEAVVLRTEKERNQLVAAIKTAFVPVTHTIRITPL